MQEYSLAFIFILLLDSVVILFLIKTLWLGRKDRKYFRFYGSLPSRLMWGALSLIISPFLRSFSASFLLAMCVSVGILWHFEFRAFEEEGIPGQVFALVGAAFLFGGSAAAGVIQRESAILDARISSLWGEIFAAADALNDAHNVVVGKYCSEEEFSEVMYKFAMLPRNGIVLHGEEQHEETFGPLLRILRRMTDDDLSPTEVNFLMRARRIEELFAEGGIIWVRSVLLPGPMMEKLTIMLGGALMIIVIFLVSPYVLGLISYSVSSAMFSFVFVMASISILDILTLIHQETEEFLSRIDEA